MSESHLFEMQALGELTPILPPRLAVGGQRPTFTGLFALVYITASCQKDSRSLFFFLINADYQTQKVWSQ